MVHAMLEVVTRWIKTPGQQNQVIVVESSDPSHSFSLGAMIAKVLNKPYFDLRQKEPLKFNGFCVVSKSRWESGWNGFFVIDVNEVVRELKSSDQQSASAIEFQCLRVAILRLASYRQSHRNKGR